MLFNDRLNIKPWLLGLYRFVFYWHQNISDRSIFSNIAQFKYFYEDDWRNEIWSKKICFACQISYYTLSILYIFVVSIPSIHFSIFNLQIITFDHYQIIFQGSIASYTIKVIGGLCYTKYKINIGTKNLRRIYPRCTYNKRKAKPKNTIPLAFSVKATRRSPNRYLGTRDACTRARIAQRTSNPYIMRVTFER